MHEYWSYCGEIESMDLMTFPDTGRFRGIVFVTFTTQVGPAGDEPLPPPCCLGCADTLREEEKWAAQGLTA